MMEGNKDESERCISIAQKCINEGDRSKALKFLYKAEKLYPTQRAKDLIELLEKLSDSSGTSSRGRSPSFDSETRARSSSARRKPAGESIRADYSDEQLEADQKIKKCKGFYEVLGVSKDAGDSEIKKQYRKLALQFHPDKNKAPGATEAFKAIGNAFAVLSDAEKRKQYDAFGSSDNKASRRSSGHRNSSYYEYSRGFESDISAEELFNMFFGGGFTPGMAANTYARRPQRRFTRDAASARHEANYSVVMQLMPIVFLVLLSVLTSFFIADPTYSLSKSVKYPYEKRTSNLRVPYFVKESFASDYQGSIRKLEAHVEEEHIANLRGACFKETNYKESMIWRARNFRDRPQEDKARNLKTPSCDSLNELYARERGW